MEVKPFIHTNYFTIHRLGGLQGILWVVRKVSYVGSYGNIDWFGKSLTSGILKLLLEGEIRYIGRTELSFKTKIVYEK